jgi:hypothetical protein
MLCDRMDESPAPHAHPGGRQTCVSDALRTSRAARKQLDAARHCLVEVDVGPHVTPPCPRSFFISTAVWIPGHVAIYKTEHTHQRALSRRPLIDEEPPLPAPAASDDDPECCEHPRPQQRPTVPRQQSSGCLWWIDSAGNVIRNAYSAGAGLRDMAPGVASPVCSSRGKCLPPVQGSSCLRRDRHCAFHHLLRHVAVSARLISSSFSPHLV